MGKFSKYLQDTALELRQVSWPTRHQALMYTLLVIGLSAVVAVFISSFDYLFSQFISSFII